MTTLMKLARVLAILITRGVADVRRYAFKDLLKVSEVLKKASTP